MRSTLALMMALLLGTACSGVTRPLSSLFASGDTVTFSHNVHKAAEVDCLTCHDAVSDATNLEVRQLPREHTCMQCHSEWKEAPTQACNRCHTAPHLATHWPDKDPSLNFSHANHLPRVKDDCTKCHVTLPEPFKKAVRPLMDACLSCHEHQQHYDEGRCDVCHKDLGAEKLKPVASFEHMGNWVKDHKLLARSSSQECFKCHDQNFCADCHTATPAGPVELRYPERVESQFIHRGDFVSRHWLEARADPTLCYRCHGQSACMQCHTKQNLSPAGQDPRSPHPATGWIARGGAEFHGTAARMDIASCAACHDQGAASVCINCHKVGGVGGNPHPVTWRALHSRAEIQHNNMCLYCHQ